MSEVEEAEEAIVPSNPFGAKALAKTSRRYGMKLSFWFISLCLYMLGLTDQSTHDAPKLLVLAWAVMSIVAVVKIITATFDFIGWLVGSYIEAMQKLNDPEALVEA